MTTKWTKEWPVKRGWYWFYGQTSRIVWDMRPYYVPVLVHKGGDGKLFYAGAGRFLYKGKGARGLWIPMVTPDAPTDYQIKEALNESEQEGIARTD